MKKGFVRGVLLILVLVMLLTGCSSNSTPQSKGDVDVAAQLRKVKIGYSGSTCEAATYIAFEKGFFLDEGLEAELVKGDFGFLKDSLATKKIDAVNGLSLAWVKPLEQGLNAQVTLGVHKGCLYALVKADSGINATTDLKGKIIGVPAIGGSQMMLLARDLATNGIDIEKDVEWRAYPAAELELILEKGEVDAIAVGEPFGTTLGSQKDRFKVLLNQTLDQPYAEEYCCIWLVNGDIVSKEPEVGAAITRAISKAAHYVDENPNEAGTIIVEKGYVGGTAELNATILSNLPFPTSVAGGYEAIKKSFEAGRDINIIDKDLDPRELADQCFTHLPGVEDEN